MTTSAFQENDHYRPTDKKIWWGRQDGPDSTRIHETIHCINLTKQPFPTAVGNAFVLIGFCCDEGIRRNQGRLGAALGPAALRQALANFPSPENLTLYDAGDVLCEDRDLEAAQIALANIVANFLTKGFRTIILGGGHELAWGSYLGLVSAFPDEDLAIVNCDAHFDIRPMLPDNKGTSGTSFAQIAEHRAANNLPFDYTCLGIQTLGNTPTLHAKAKEYHTNILLADDFHLRGGDASRGPIEQVIQRSDIISLSLCLDVFAAAVAPGVSAPQPLGIFPWQLIPTLRRLAASHKVRCLDIAELCPPSDTQHITAKLGASLIVEFLAGMGKAN